MACAVLTSGGLTFEFAEDGFFVVEKVPDEAVGVAVFECEGILRAWSEDAWSEGVGKSVDKVVVGGGEIDESSEVSGDGVECSYVVEAELTKRGLEDFDAWCRVNAVGGDRIVACVLCCGINGLDDLVDL